MIILAFILIPLLGWIALDPSRVVDLFIQVLYVLNWIMNLILMPINFIIDSTMPAVSNGITYIYQFIELIKTYLFWALDATLIPVFSIQLLMTYFLFVPFVGILAWTLKTPLSWFKKIF